MEKIKKVIVNLIDKFVTQKEPLCGRELVTSLYIKGSGIEIGALHNPLVVPKIAKVKYVDRMNVSDLRKHYPELGALNLVDVDIISDGELLENIPDNSQDFVIANHFLEHCQNPILALQNMMRVVRHGHFVYIALPDKRYLYIDIDRPITKFEHIEEDYLKGPESSKKSHFEDWVTYVDKIQNKKEKEAKVAALISMDYSIHFHVWTQNEIMEFLIKAKKYFPFEVEMIYKNGHEIIFILTK